MASTMCSRQCAAPLVAAAGGLPDRDAQLMRISLFRANTLFQTSSLSAKGGRAVLPAVRVQATEAAEATFGGSPEPLADGGVKLYVGNLPWNVDSQALAEIFQESGVVEEVEVILDRDTGRSRGFAFVVMSSPEDAQAVIERFDGSDLGGRTLRVNFPAPPGQRRERERGGPQQRERGPRTPRSGGDSRAESPNKLYVGNLSWSVDDLALQELFSEYGQVLEARVVTDRSTGRSRGFGFVTLANQSEVSQALDSLDGAEFDGRQLRVNPAGQKPGA